MSGNPVQRWRMPLIAGCVLTFVHGGLRAWAETDGSFAPPAPPMWRGEGEPPLPPPWSPTPHRVEIVEPSRPYQVMVFEPGRPSTGRIALVVASGLYPAVSNAVAGYAADLRAQGFSTVTLTFGGSAEQLRGTLSNLHASAAAGSMWSATGRRSGTAS